jgi:hypothetical protein
MRSGASASFGRLELDNVTLRGNSERFGDRLFNSRKANLATTTGDCRLAG